MELADYAQLMKRAFKKGNYLINCDYGCAGIKVGDSCEKMGFEHISDKRIALVIYLAGLKNNNSRYKFGYYVTSVKTRMMCMMPLWCLIHIPIHQLLAKCQ